MVTWYDLLMIHVYFMMFWIGIAVIFLGVRLINDGYHRRLAISALKHLNKFINWLVRKLNGVA